MFGDGSTVATSTVELMIEFRCERFYGFWKVSRGRWLLSYYRTQEEAQTAAIGFARDAIEKGADAVVLVQSDKSDMVKVVFEA